MSGKVIGMNEVVGEVVVVGAEAGIEVEASVLSLKDVS